MLYFTQQQKKILISSDCFNYKCGAFREMMNYAYARIVEMDDVQNVIDGVCAQYGNTGFAIKTAGQDIVYDDIKNYAFEDINEYYKHEIAVFAILCAAFKALNLDYKVSLTSQKCDGGFDIVVSKKANDGNWECEFIIDVKSGHTCDNNHVEWSTIKGKDKFLIKVVKNAKDIGVRKNNLDKGVYYASWDRFVCNLTSVMCYRMNFQEINEIKKLFKLTLRQLVNPESRKRA